MDRTIQGTLTEAGAQRVTTFVEMLNSGSETDRDAHVTHLKQSSLLDRVVAGCG